MLSTDPCTGYCAVQPVKRLLRGAELARGWVCSEHMVTREKSHFHEFVIFHLRVRRRAQAITPPSPLQLLPTSHPPLYVLEPRGQMLVKDIGLHLPTELLENLPVTSDHEFRKVPVDRCAVGRTTQKFVDFLCTRTVDVCSLHQ